MYCDNWTETGRERSLASRRKAQGRHDRQSVKIICEARAQGLSWRRTAAILSESGTRRRAAAATAGRIPRSPGLPGGMGLSEGLLHRTGLASYRQTPRGTIGPRRLPRLIVGDTCSVV